MTEPKLGQLILNSLKYEIRRLICLMFHGNRRIDKRDGTEAWVECVVCGEQFEVFLDH